MLVGTGAGWHTPGGWKLKHGAQLLGHHFLCTLHVLGASGQATVFGSEQSPVCRGGILCLEQPKKFFFFSQNGKRFVPIT